MAAPKSIEYCNGTSGIIDVLYLSSMQNTCKISTYFKGYSMHKVTGQDTVCTTVAQQFYRLFPRWLYIDMSFVDDHIDHHNDFSHNMSPTGSYASFYPSMTAPPRRCALSPSRLQHLIATSAFATTPITKKSTFVHGHLSPTQYHSYQASFRYTFSR